MNVVVIGGTGLVGTAVVPALVHAGHSVRIASRGACEVARRMREAGLDVEGVDANVTVEGSLRGVAESSEAVIHLVGTSDRQMRHSYEVVNVEGTRRAVAEAERAGTRRFVLVSSLGADRGATPFERSKLESEAIARSFSREWVVIRPGIVYGPRDETVTLLLRMLRTSPIIPMIERGRQPLQPIWHEDLGQALVAAMELERAVGRVLEVAGDERTTPRELIEAFGRLIDKKPRFLPLRPSVAPMVSRVAEWLGFTAPLNDAKLWMLLEGNVIEPPEANALRRSLGIVPTPLDAGLRSMLHDLPLQTPEEGVGEIMHRTYRASARGAKSSPEEVIAAFRERCAEVMPLDFEAEPRAARCLDRGATLTGRLPLRGNFLMRVVEVAPRRVTLATVEGHPISGIVRFAADQVGGEVGFVVDVYARASNWLDRSAIALFGGALENLNWSSVARRGARLTRGHVARRVEKRVEKLRGREAEQVGGAIMDLVRSVERPATLS